MKKLTKQEEDITKHGSDSLQPPPEQRFDHGRPQSRDEKSQPPFSSIQHSSNPLTNPDAFEDPSLSPLALSPISPCHMLGFTDRMEQLVDAGIKFAPLPSPIIRPQHQTDSVLTQSLKVKRQVPLPPQGLQRTPSLQTDKYACVQNATSFNWYVLGPGCTPSGTHDSFQDKPGPCVLNSSSIYVVIGNRKRMVNLLSKKKKHLTANLANLASIPRQQQPVPKNYFNTIALALLNVRS